MSFKSMFQDVRDAVDWVHFKVKRFSVSLSVRVICQSNIAVYINSRQL